MNSFFKISIISIIFLCIMLTLNILKGSGYLNKVAKVIKRPLCVSMKYDHANIEQKWQKIWEEKKVFSVQNDPSMPKKYVLDMFPYPSAAGLHVGHPEGYTASDIMSRYWRMNGFDVLHPMGWDSFGLPAEQHAINTGTHPSETTNKNIDTFRRQLKSLGFSYDWSREIATTDEDYVRWTQWIFIQLFKHGLAYQNKINVNWCPALGTVLANEEIIDGKSERGNHPVTRLPLRQWALRITKYADRLEEDLKLLNWPDGTIQAQKQWIGKSEGAQIYFKTENPNLIIDIFTTRPDTLMGVTYLVLSPEHEFVPQLTSKGNLKMVEEYQKLVASKSDLERTSVGKDKAKTGVPLGSYAIHPISGEKLSIWIADYVLTGYGTGAVMAVPAHDERDFQFALNFNLPIKKVIESFDSESLPFTGEGKICNSGLELDGLKSSDAKNIVLEQLKKTQSGRLSINYKLRDWVFSRQRYWGEPIPIYFPLKFLSGNEDSWDPRSNKDFEILFDQPIPLNEDELPLKLPPMENFLPGDDPHGCLARAVDWRFFQKNGKWFARETNTMPQWAGSCWYYLRFTDPQNNNSILSENSKRWLPVDLYVGGQEHAVLHLLYARFWHKFLHDINVIDHPEPFIKLVHQGMILGSDGEKMSKSRGNVVNPDDIVKLHGADALRLYEMFMGPLEAVKPWQSEQLIGVVRFRDRIFNLLSRSIEDLPINEELNFQINKTIKKVTQDIDSLNFNTAISSLMILTTSLASLKGSIPKSAIETLVLLVSPFAPHLAEECWFRLGHHQTLAFEPWPKYQEITLTNEICTISVQINGKFRGIITVDNKTIAENDIVKAVQEFPKFSKFFENQSIKKIIYVKGKILNIVLN